MAKATAECKCRICGTTFTKVKRNCYNRKEADSWERWAESNYDLCPSCWAKEKIKEEKEAGLIAKVRLEMPYTVLHGDEPRICFVTYGDTYPIRDKLKEIGAVYSEDYPSEDSQFAGGLLGNMLDFHRPLKRWAIYADVNEYDRVRKEIIDLGFAIEEPEKLTIAMWFANIQKLKADKEKEKLDEKRREDAVEEIVNRTFGNFPSWPEFLSTICPKGAKWNGMVYGKSGSRHIYVNQEKVFLTDAEGSELEKTSEARENWIRLKKELTDFVRDCKTEEEWTAKIKEYLEILETEKNKANEIVEKIREEIGEIPSWPESVKEKWPEGAKWNGRVYGKKGNRAIYLHDKKIELTDEEASDMERTLEERDTWRKRKKELEKELKK